MTLRFPRMSPSRPEMGVVTADARRATVSTLSVANLGSGSTTWGSGLGFAGTLTFFAVDGTLIHIPDAGLRACINDAIGQSADADIAVYQVEEISYLDCPDYGIRSLEGIDQLPNLGGIYFEDNHISDLSSLAPIAERLWGAVLTRNHITDLSPLDGNRPLEIFDVRYQSVDLGEVEVDDPIVNPITWVDGTPVELNEDLYDPAANSFTPTEEGPGSVTWGLLTPPVAAFSTFEPDVFSGTIAFTVVTPAVVDEPGETEEPGEDETPELPVKDELVTTGQDRPLSSAVILTATALVFIGGVFMLVSSRRRANRR